MTQTLPTQAPSPGLRLTVRAVLVVFPLLYLLHGFFPHTRELFGGLDPGRWWQFWGAVAVLHWASVAIALASLRRYGLRPADIGLTIRLGPLVGILAGLAVFGVLLVVIREMTGPLEVFGQVPVFGEAAPSTAAQRLAWVAMAITAGFCEEVVYRGYGIGAQRAAGVGLTTALTWSTTAFVFLHGFSAFELFPVYIAVALGLAWLYLRTGSLVPGIILHSCVDLLVILAT